MSGVDPLRDDWQLIDDVSAALLRALGDGTACGSSLARVVRAREIVRDDAGRAHLDAPLAVLHRAAWWLAQTLPQRPPRSLPGDAPYADAEQLHREVAAAAAAVRAATADV